MLGYIRNVKKQLGFEMSKMLGYTRTVKMVRLD